MSQACQRNMQSGPSGEGGADDSIGFIRTVFEDWQTRKKATVLIDEMRGKPDGLLRMSLSQHNKVSRAASLFTLRFSTQILILRQMPPRKSLL